MRINTNINALNTLRNLNASEKSVADSTAKLSSGFRINRASDDAAGLAIANKLRNTGAALTQASRNADQAASMLQIADGAAQTLGGIIDRMKQLAAAAASASAGSGADDQRPKLQAEFDALNSEITRIVATTKYQGVQLLAGGGTPAGHVLDASTITDAGDIADIKISAGVADGTYTISSDGTSNGVVTLDDGNGNSQKLIAVDGVQTLNFDKLGVTITTGVGFVASTTSSAASFDTQTFTEPLTERPGRPGPTTWSAASLKVALFAPSFVRKVPSSNSISEASTSHGVASRSATSLMRLLPASFTAMPEPNVTRLPAVTSL